MISRNNVWMIAVGIVLFAGTTSTADGATAPSKWSADFALATGCNGPVHAVLAAPGGGYFAGGNFSACASVAVNNIAYYDPLSNRWSALQNVGDRGNGVHGQVLALHLHDGQLYAGGDIYAVNQDGATTASGGLARWDGQRWYAVNGPRGGYLGPFDSLGSHAGALYAGGQTLYRVEGDILEVVDDSSRQIVGQIRSLQSYNQELYAGGSFNIPDAPLVRLARWDGTNWHPVGRAGGTGPNGLVNALQIWNDALYVTGVFSAINDSDAGANLPANRIARWDGTNWSALGSGLDAPGQVLRVIENQLYVGGAFTAAGGTPAKHVARWNGSAWSGFDSGPGGFPAQVFDLVQTELGLVVAGTFGWISSVAEPDVPVRTVNSIAEFRAGQWLPWGSAEAPALGANGDILASTRYQGQLYVGGMFTSMGGLASNHIARWDGVQWRAVGEAEGNGVDGPVHALQATSDGLYVGGSFLHADVGGARKLVRRIARWDGAQWHAVGVGDHNGFNATVQALAWSAPYLYAGGRFRTQIDGESGFPANGIARWNGSEWSVLSHADSGGRGLWANVQAITVHGTDVYAGIPQGAVDAGIDSFGARGVVHWDGAQWRTLDVPGGSGLGLPEIPPFASVESLLFMHGQLYAGGRFSAAGEGSAQTTLLRNLARWDGQSWQAVGGSGPSGPSSPVLALSEFNGQMVVGGWFNTITRSGLPDIEAHGIALWNGSNWSTLESGVRSGSIPRVRTVLAVGDSGLYVGGAFGQAGPHPAANLAFYEESLFSSSFE